MLENYNNPILMFSGGKDSIATLLYLLELKETNFRIVFADSGLVHKDIEDTINRIWEKLDITIPFIRLDVDRSQNWLDYGLPSDIVPQESTVFGQAMLGDTKGIKLQSKFDCCYRNVMQPVYNYAISINSNCIIRGNKLTDRLKDTTINGYIENGITYFNPIENWTNITVLDYIQKQLEWDKLPDHLYLKHSSIDCIDCTAYLSDRQDYFKDFLPKMPIYEKMVNRNLQAIRDLVLDELDILNITLGD